MEDTRVGQRRVKRVPVPPKKVIQPPRPPDKSLHKVQDPGTDPPVELETWRRPNMKGTITRRRIEEEVPVPPIEVVQPPRPPDRATGRAHEVSTGSQVVGRPQADPRHLGLLGGLSCHLRKQ